MVSGTRQTATRQQTTEVRFDNVATAQVHHCAPEPRARVLLSDVNFRGGKVILCATFARKQGSKDTRRVAPSVPQLVPDLGQGVPWKPKIRVLPEVSCALW